jgi:hypothetical protein
MESLGEDVCQLHGLDLDQLRLSVSNHFMSKVLPDINVLGPFPSADGVVTIVYAHCVVLVQWCGCLLSEAKSFQKSSEIQNLSPSRRCGIVRSLCR